MPPHRLQHRGADRILARQHRDIVVVVRSSQCGHQRTLNRVVHGHATGTAALVAREAPVRTVACRACSRSGRPLTEQPGGPYRGVILPDTQAIAEERIDHLGAMRTVAVGTRKEAPCATEGLHARPSGDRVSSGHDVRGVYAMPAGRRRAGPGLDRSIHSEAAGPVVTIETRRHDGRLGQKRDPTGRSGVHGMAVVTLGGAGRVPAVRAKEVALLVSVGGSVCVVLIAVTAAAIHIRVQLMRGVAVPTSKRPAGQIVRLGVAPRGRGIERPGRAEGDEQECLPIPTVR